MVAQENPGQHRADGSSGAIKRALATDTIVVFGTCTPAPVSDWNAAPKAESLIVAATISAWRGLFKSNPWRCAFVSTLFSANAWSEGQMLSSFSTTDAHAEENDDNNFVRRDGHTERTSMPNAIRGDESTERAAPSAADKLVTFACAHLGGCWKVGTDGDMDGVCGAGVDVGGCVSRGRARASVGGGVWW